MSNSKKLYRNYKFNRQLCGRDSSVKPAAGTLNYKLFLCGLETNSPGLKTDAAEVLGTVPPIIIATKAPTIFTNTFSAYNYFIPHRILLMNTQFNKGGLVYSNFYAAFKN